MARGDHLLVVRMKPVMFVHHGIDAGRGWVIHFPGQPGGNPNAAINRIRLKAFQNGDKLGVREYVERSDIDETIERAESKLGVSGYDLVYNNCEHFATWCCTGVEWSEQVDTVGRHGMTGAGLLLSLWPPARVAALGASAAHWFLREMKALDRSKNYKDHWAK